MTDIVYGFNTSAAFRLRKAGNIAYPVSVAAATAYRNVFAGFDLIPMKGESMNAIPMHIDDPCFEGNIGPIALRRVGIDCNGGLDLLGKFLGLDNLVGAVMGWEKPANNEANNVSPYFMESIGGSGAKVSGTIPLAGYSSVTDNVTFTADEAVFTAGMVGEFIRIISANNEGEIRRIVTYVSTTVVTIGAAFTNDMAAGVAFEVSALFRHQYELSPHLHNQLISELYANYVADTSGVSTDLIHRWGNLGINKGIEVWDYRGIMVQRMELTLNQDGLSISCNLVGFDLLRDALDVHTPANWTYHPLQTQDQNEHIRIGDSVFRMKDFTAVTPGLATANTQDITEFTLTIDRTLDVYRGTGTGIYISEPVIGDRPKVTGTLTFPRYVTATQAFLTDIDNDDAKMADLIITGSIPTGLTLPRKLEIGLKKFKFKIPGYSAGGRGRVSPKMEFEVMEPLTEPFGMPASTLDWIGGLLIRVQNEYPYNVFRGAWVAPEV